MKATLNCLPTDSVEPYRESGFSDCVEAVVFDGDWVLVDMNSCGLSSLLG